MFIILKTRKTLLLLFLLPFVSYAQDKTDPILDTYLAAHRLTIKLSDDNFLPDRDITGFLSQKTQGKNLFIYGEGFSHNLRLNTQLRRMFMNYLIPNGLKYYFEEGARSWIVEDYLRISDNVNIDSSFIRFSHYSPAYYKAEKELYKTGHYEYIAIDFERPQSFHRTLSMLLNTVDKEKQQKLCQLAPYFQDTSYLLLPRNKFVQFYKEQQNKFYTDSNSFKPLLRFAYPYFRYLMSDPEPASFNDNRNTNMAMHVLQQIGTPQPGELYILSIGLEHIQKRDGLRKTTTTILGESEQLKGRILITTLYCDKCETVNGRGDNNWFKAMNGSILASFQKAANSDIVLFDLTTLPEQYKEICNNTDLLVFAKGHN